MLLQDRPGRIDLFRHQVQDAAAAQERLAAFDEKPNNRSVRVIRRIGEHDVERRVRPLGDRMAGRV